MDPLGVRNLLLILLLPLSDQSLATNTTAKLNHSSRSIEFCLHVPGDSAPYKPPSTSPSKLQTTKNREPEPSQSSWGSTQAVTSTDPPGRTEELTSQEQEPITGPQPVMEEIIVPVHYGPVHSPKRCRCDSIEMKLPTETSPVRSSKVWPPTKNCPSPEFLETLQDGRRVCVTAHSFQTYFGELLRSPNKPKTTVPPPTTAAPTTAAPTTELPRTTHPPPIKIEEKGSQCEFCTSDLENITSEAVQSLFVWIPPFPCETLIYINLKDDDGSMCVDLNHVGFQKLLENLGTLPSFPPNETLKTTVNQCRCRDTNVTSTDAFSRLSAMIWFPNDTCNSTEYIETLMDGSEVCVTPPNLIVYLNFFRPRLIQKDTVEVLSVERVLPNVVVETRIELICTYRYCPHFDWTSIDSKDVESLQMNVDSPTCPIYLEVHLKRLEGRPNYLCVSTQEQWFPDVLKQLDID